jgi:large subunit ribosomal protein L21
VTVVNNINEQLVSHDAGRLFAVVHVAGKQRKVTPEDVIVLDKHIDADNGERIRLNKVRDLLP